jgi:uncharacterized protein YndB with AHSA1/START domain
MYLTNELRKVIDMKGQSVMDSTMEEQSVIHSTFVVEHSYTTTPERVFDAFADPAKKRKWYAERGGFDVEDFQMDFRVGGVDLGRYRFKPGTPVPAGTPILYDTTYQDIVPDRRIVLAYTVTLGESRISSSLATFEFLPTQQGTDLIFTEQGAYFGGDGPQIREAGWKYLFKLLEDYLARG